MARTHTTELPEGLRFHTILDPHDFTPESDVALERAGELASRSAGVVHLLHVLPYPAGTSFVDPTPAVWADRSLLDAKRSVGARLLALGDRVDAPVEAHVTIGTPAAQICETAEHIGADLIVMSTHARRGVASLFQGSIAARTVRRASCPVFTLRCSAAHDSPPSGTAKPH
jgi:nucleotide-binding universal stress UspA family protein